MRLIAYSRLHQFIRKLFLYFDKLWLSLGWLLIALTVFLSLMPTPPQVMDFYQSDKLEHLFTYTILMLWFAQIYERHSYLCLGLSFIAMGVSLELLQGLSGFRTFEYSDILANTTGVLFGWLLAKTSMANCLIWIKTRVTHLMQN
ncbi:MAG: VanZ family protein [Nitrospirae bacterium CG_4_10_14_0_8_um_filter_41_23]|nr:VanZ family protein [Nitrospirota bacterium]PIQ93432.1 MAG: VanZ family protein [Nitrospirae bacterium CG11_big_fil_rev_8_21_14_0_20_41_14]PIV44312.1 MAG: VanZ family protein [Nitrospirae bacterium CG02_land_8_20_14_3_00_41_53]PIW86600.1 MAG: VanZ family protein [Nitrospirae bacterium CG_4_8_14_3_um_filter_41_47]PIY86065.1 MAG: VanZ family protein [Nitrospirae bacterium CG_4_10_14_0_8_um_filter_41_23]PJA79479.1 MAG: VanZ family protein [Nitrospirae bacterium CG_4_9_14_3_um_filter_41_27]